MSDLPACGSVPEGVQLGSKVALLPCLLPAFGGALWHQWTLNGQRIYNPLRLFHASYQWIRRGTPFAQIVVPTSPPSTRFFGTIQTKPSTEIAYLRSPLNGLLLQTDVTTGSVKTSMLLAADEPSAESGDYVFGEACELLWKHRDLLYFQPESYRGQYDDDKIRAFIAEQKSSQCSYVDAAPHAFDYFDEARQRHPNLVPYLAHLK